MNDNKTTHFNLPDIDIADVINMSHEDFADLSNDLKWCYFHIIHYGVNTSYYQYLPLN